MFTPPFGGALFPHRHYQGMTARKRVGVTFAMFNDPMAMRQLGEVRRHAPRVVAGHQLGRRAPTRFVLEMEIPKLLPARAPHDEARILVLLDGPRRGEGARRVWGGHALSKCPKFPAQRASPSGPLDTPLIRSQ